MQSQGKLRTQLILAACALCAMLLATSTANAFTGATPSQLGFASKVLFHGVLPGTIKVRDGEHEFRIRVYGKDGALVHEEIVRADVRTNSYDVLLGSTNPLIVNAKEEYTVGVSIDNQKEIRDASTLKLSSVLSEELLGVTLDVQQNRLISAIDRGEVSAQYAERLAGQRGLLSNPYYGGIPSFPRFISDLAGLKVEMSLASPNLPTLNAYDMAKYGRIAIEYNNFATIDGNNFGIAGQAMHVAHHLLLYAAGFTTDINGDGMFMMTLGAARYQIGNSRDEPFVNAPFVRFKYQSSNARIFGYSEFETTIHFRSYISGTVGIGLRINDRLKLIGGLHHTEFVMPTEQQVRIVDGFHGIVNWGF
ncbi:MAG: hypothetical protein ABI444_05595 [Candidatus Kapaibacterium sp.]|jgi:hypothetical protein